MTQERYLFIMNEIYPQITVLTQASYNLVDPSHEVGEIYNAVVMFNKKLNSVKDITEEEKSFINEDTNWHCIWYTDHLQGGHGNYNKIERKLFMETPSVKQAWKEFFTKKI